MAEDLARAIGAAVRGERARLHLSQADLAERLGMSTSSVARLERAERIIGVTELPELCEALGVTLDRLLQDADPADLARLGL
jgi:transcriptional regulator with XRE-family HTH domain